MTGGAKNSEKDAVNTRVNQDSNFTAATYADYVAAGDGNGRRNVGVPINTGHPDYLVVQIGAFFLQTSYGGGGNDAFCAEYLSPWVQGAKTKGAADGSGAYVARLIQ